jgi:hypothetical protein
LRNMSTNQDPFKRAERYIELKKLCMPPSWGDTAIRMNEMIVAPMVALFSLFTGDYDLFMMASAAMTTHRVWSEWLEYDDLRFEVQRMYLLTMASGGPQIVTNDNTYLPYVYADAVMRLRMRFRQK